MDPCHEKISITIYFVDELGEPFGIGKLLITFISTLIHTNVGIVKPTGFHELTEWALKYMIGKTDVSVTPYLLFQPLSESPTAELPWEAWLFCHCLLHLLVR